MSKCKELIAKLDEQKIDEVSTPKILAAFDDGASKLWASLAKAYGITDTSEVKPKIKKQMLEDIDYAKGVLETLLKMTQDRL
jgi:hypothetical protein